MNSRYLARLVMQQQLHWWPLPISDSWNCSWIESIGRSDDVDEGDEGDEGDE